MGASKQKTSTNQMASGPGFDQLAAQGPQRIEDQYQSDIANPNRLVPQAQQYAGDVLSGQYLDPATNPNLGALTKSITDPIQASLSAQFGRAGRGTSASSSGLAGAMSQGMASGLAAPLFNQYNVERGLQQGAAGLAPSLDATSSLPLEQYLERMRALGMMGQKGTTTSTSTASPGQTLAGAAMTAAGIFSANPMLLAGGASMLSKSGAAGGGAIK